MLSIQEVKKQTGISVRTLRYYDEINLLLPAGKTEGGHRLYGEIELQKLQKIQFLKTLKFTLKEIKTILSHENWDGKKELQSQLELVSQERKRLMEMENTLIGLINAATVDGKFNLNDTIKVIQLLQEKSLTKEAYREKLFTSKNEQELLNKLPNMNRDDDNALEWMELLGQMQRDMHKGIEAPIIQQIIGRFYEKTIDTFGYNEEFLNKVWDIRKSSEKSAQAGFYPMEAEFLVFFEKAWDYFIANNQNHTN